MTINNSQLIALLQRPEQWHLDNNYLSYHLRENTHVIRIYDARVFGDKCNWVNNERRGSVSLTNSQNYKTIQVDVDYTAELSAAVKSTHDYQHRINMADFDCILEAELFLVTEEPRPGSDAQTIQADTQLALDTDIPDNNTLKFRSFDWNAHREMK